MQLSTNHITFTSSTDIAEIVKPLKQLGITHFSYMRSYDNGARIYLGENVEFRDYYLKKKYYLTGNAECKPKVYKEQAMLWSTLPNQKIVDDCCRSRGIDHGMILFQPQQGYTDTFSFATQAGNDRIINTYLSKMDIFISFKNYFREKAAPIINQGEKQKIILPFNDKLDISKSLINDDCRHLFLSNKISLTKRQLECCHLLMQGKTIKEMASIIGLSIRTVEDYLTHIRVKLGCRNKTELIIKLTTLL